MKLQVFLTASALAASTLAAPATSLFRHVVHEKRSGLTGLQRGQRVEGDSIVTFRIGLKQSNLEYGYEYITNVSDPSSSDYGKLWTAEDVRNTFAPSKESTDSVRGWLASSGVGKVTEKKGFLSFETTVDHAEQLMQSAYYEHEDRQTGAVRIGCDEYHLPEHISQHVDFITPGVALSSPLKKRSIPRQRATSTRYGISGSHMRKPTYALRRRSATSASPAASDLSNCGTEMTPACLRALYDLPSASEVATSYKSDASNQLGVFETGDDYSQSDLNSFFAKYAPNVPQGTHPKLASVENATVPKNAIAGGESNVDLDLMYSLVYPQTVTLYQVDPKYNKQETEGVAGLSVAVENLLDALDGSYCDKNETTVGQECGIYAPKKVISVSYGASELFYPMALQERQCNEFMKLGLQGHTFTIASGDYGVADRSYSGETDGCINPNKISQFTSEPMVNGTVFNPGYPQNCPYVLSVGATQLTANNTVDSPESVMNVPWSVIYNGSAAGSPPDKFSSSGGFSNYFSRPDYQSSAVNTYFSQHDPGYPSYTFNGVSAMKSGTNIGANGGKYNKAGRAFPDVSANGAFLQFYDQGELQSVFGTSLAAPIWASVITLINEKRSENGKGPVGFVNPTLYKHPEVFNDITLGSNPGCGTAGFKAVPGWDPATGLGTPDFPKLLDLFLSLP